MAFLRLGIGGRYHNGCAGPAMVSSMAESRRAIL